MKKPRVLGLITARGGSKGVPGKNIMVVGGVPLIAWTIIEAKKSKFIDRLILSSDDDNIISTAKQYNCEVPFKRPKELAGDEASSIDVIRHAVSIINQKYDLVVLLQPTSPLRLVDDIDNCIRICIETGAPSVISMCNSKQSPIWMYHLDKNGLMQPVIDADERPTRRQDMAPVYIPNGAVYVVTIEQLNDKKTLIFPQTRGYVMPTSRSLDIDTVYDMQWLKCQCEHNPLLVPKID